MPFCGSKSAEFQRLREEREECSRLGAELEEARRKHEEDQERLIAELAESRTREERQCHELAEAGAKLWSSEAEAQQQKKLASSRGEEAQRELQELSSSLFGLKMHRDEAQAQAAADLKATELRESTRHIEETMRLRLQLSEFEMRARQLSHFQAETAEQNAELFEAGLKAREHATERTRLTSELHEVLAQHRAQAKQRRAEDERLKKRPNNHLQKRSQAPLLEAEARLAMECETAIIRDVELREERSLRSETTAELERVRRQWDQLCASFVALEAAVAPRLPGGKATVISPAPSTCVPSPAETSLTGWCWPSEFARLDAVSVPLPPPRPPPALRPLPSQKRAAPALGATTPSRPPEKASPSPAPGPVTPQRLLDRSGPRRCPSAPPARRPHASSPSVLALSSPSSPTDVTGVMFVGSPH